MPISRVITIYNDHIRLQPRFVSVIVAYLNVIIAIVVQIEHAI